MSVLRIAEMYSPWLVWLLPLLSSIMVPLVSRLGKEVRNIFVIIVGTVTLFLSASLVPIVLSKETIDLTVEWVSVGKLNISIGVLLDPLSVLFANLVGLIGLVVLIYSLGYMAHEEGLDRYFFFMLLFIGSMTGLVLADNLLQLFIFWEMVGLCSYALVSFWYKKPEAVKAGIKVFIMTKIGDIALLAAILLIYAELHDLSYSALFTEYIKIPHFTFTVIAMLTLFGALVKSAQLPLHSWLYSAMEAPTPVSCLLHGATMVKAGVYLTARTHVIFCKVPLWLNTLAWVGAATAIVGALLALQTTDIKGVPAYSTVSQIGFMMVALGVSPSPSSLGWFAGLFHTISHAFFQGLGFLAIGSIVHQLGTRDMRKMGGLRRDMPITFALCIIVILARSGIPPFCSFFSKGLIAKSLMLNDNVILTAIIYAAAALTFAYSYRFLVITFAGEKSSYIKDMKVHEAPWLMSASSSILAAGTIILGFLGGSLISFLGTHYTFKIESFLSLESLLFVMTLLIGGLPIYLIYQRKIIDPEDLRKGVFGALQKIVEENFFLDRLYTTLTLGFLGSSKAILKVDMSIFERLPHLVAKGIVRISQLMLVSFDLTLDRMVAFTAELVAFHSVKVKMIHKGALSHFVLAATLGIFLLYILLVLTT
ncbi:MAG TPA: NADH-quinone oxidoreductase subunit L [Candidatus Bathyarchaeota archaeon]|nr:NADH-quinone oxidoreductase subunit L [Candidatus Bathyarchaeota archaeon]